MRFDLRGELGLFASATQFLTRLPLPRTPYRPDWLPRAAKYFPLVGILVGLLAASVLVVAQKLWPSPIPEILAVLAAVLVTGALHEDGLADSADSLGGRTREQRLAIMKDSRIGTYGVLAMTLCLALRVAALAALAPAVAAAALVAGHALARLPAVVTMAWQTYAGEHAAAKVEHAHGQPRTAEVATAAILAFLPFIALPLAPGLGGLALGGTLAGLALFRLCRSLGGYTGDVLGAGIAIFETGFLLGAAMSLGRG